MINYEELKNTFGDLLDEQLLLESRYKEIGQAMTRQAYEQAKLNDQADKTKLGQKFIRHRFDIAREAVEVWMQAKLQPKRGVKPAYVGILADLVEIYKDEPKELVDLLTFCPLSACLNMISRLSGESNLTISMLSNTMLEPLFDEVNLHRYLAENSERTPLINAEINKRVQATYRRAYAQAWMRRDNYTSYKVSKSEGVALIASLLDVLATATGYFKVNLAGANNTVTIEPTQKFVDAWYQNERAVIEASYHLCPTIIPPKAWTTFEDGGYYGELQATSKLLRVRELNTAFGRDYLKRINQLELTKVKKAINAIQATPWKVNTQVLEVVKTLVKQGGGRAGLPYFDIAPKPAVLPDKPTEEELIAYKKIMVHYYKSETRRKSLALRALSSLRTAEEFSKYDKIYFPCNMDFRGRVYPIPNFNFQGDDLTKGLILFAEAPACQSNEPIGWLMVHTANCAGVDKVSFDDRKQWVLDNEQAILACAEDPIGCDFWMHQDEPFEFLACCFEWQAWKKWEAEHGGSAVGFVSGIPVAFDGTCSGLQHFSAILRDPIGGQAVNLVPSVKPSDIYGIVASKVNERLDIDCLQGTPDKFDEDKGKIKYGTKTLAQIWKSHGVNRKVTKRPTMTLAYGAKEYGFRDQIMDDTIVPAMRNQGEACPFNEHNKWQASTYMAKVIWEAVGKTVVKAVEGMEWLQDCAKKVTKDGNVVTWVTPMGLPIQQNYIKVETNVVQIRCNGKRIRLYTRDNTGNIDKSAQSSGIAPNFIHSMDASHLQLTVCNCVDQGIKHFAMIHDSYAAPVAQSSDMFRIVRESFVQMYTENDVLKTFKANMQVYVDDELNTPPDKGNLDLNQVLNSPYIFS